MKLLVFFLSFASSAFAAMISGIRYPVGESLPAPRADQVEFKIAFDSRFTQTTKVQDKWAVAIYCSWKNISSQPVAILLKDHDSYHGTLSYVFGTQIRITDNAGRLLTTTWQSPDGWWDSTRSSSQTSEIMPGDIISLRPGETVIRRFGLTDILAGLLFNQAADKAPTTASGSKDMTGWKTTEFKFPAGDSKIEVRLHDLVASNSLTFRAKEASTTAAP